MQQANPGVFTAYALGAGQASATNSDGSVNSSGNPAARGDIMTLSLTGAGVMVQ